MMKFILIGIVLFTLSSCKLVKDDKCEDDAKYQFKEYCAPVIFQENFWKQGNSAYANACLILFVSKLDSCNKE